VFKSKLWVVLGEAPGLVPVGVSVATTGV